MAQASVRALHAPAGLQETVRQKHNEPKVLVEPEKALKKVPPFENIPTSIKIANGFHVLNSFRISIRQ